ncbi:MAG: hypothetical protein U1F43_16830 [Myxococcota bacterium]
MLARNSSLFAAMALLAGGCSSDGPGTPAPGSHSDPLDGAFQIVVAPAEVASDAVMACYAIDVTDAHGDLVWSNPDLCTNEFSTGENGTLAFVGLCDASGGLNTVRISLTRLVDAKGVDLGNWGNQPPTFIDDFVCTANADTMVKASFLVIGQGTKGFLDVQVSVKQIECNAKIDCQSDFLTGSDAEAVCDCAPTDHVCLAEAAAHSGWGTIVVALACDAQGEDFTQLMLDQVVMTCTNSLGRPVTVRVDPSVGTGAFAGYPNQFVFGAIGNAGVSTDGTSFWTLALGIRSGWTDCHLSTRMAASDGRALDSNDQFPIIVATNIPFGFAADGTFACLANPLDGETSGLTSTWGSGAALDFRGCLDADGTVDLCP